MSEDEMVGWHHRLNGQEFEQALGDGERQESLACCSPWGHKESDMTERLNDDNRTKTPPKMEDVNSLIDHSSFQRRSQSDNLENQRSSPGDHLRPD